MAVFKKRTKNRFLVIIGLILIAVVIGAAFFFTNKKKADSLRLQPNSTIVFSKYQVLNGKVVTLFKDSNNEFAFYDDKNKEIYRTNEFIEDFYLLDSNTITYRTRIHNNSTNKDFTTVKVFAINEKSCSEIYNTYNNILLSSAGGKILILDKTNNQLLCQKNNKQFDTITLNKKYSQIIKSEKRIFLISYKLINGDVVSSVDEFKDGTLINPFTINYKVINITTDCSNPNIVYCTFETTKPISNQNVSDRDSSGYDINAKIIKRLAVMKKYIVNLSASDNGERIYDNLTGVVVSMKDKNVYINLKDNSINLLNDDLSIDSKLTSINTNSLLSFLQYDKEQNFLYYIDANGNIKRV